MKTVKKRTVLLLLAVLTAAGILYFAQELNWAPARQNPPPSQTEEAPAEEVPEPETPAPEAPAPEAPEPETPAQPQSGVLEQQPLMVSEHFARDEYRCDCQGSCDGFPAEPDPELVRRVEALRQAVGAAWPGPSTNAAPPPTSTAPACPSAPWPPWQRTAASISYPTTETGMCMWRYEKAPEVFRGFFSGKLIVESGKFRCKSAAGRFDAMRPEAAVPVVFALAKTFHNYPLSIFNSKGFNLSLCSPRPTLPTS